jgi:hypothetical protein
MERIYEGYLCYFSILLLFARVFFSAGVRLELQKSGSWRNSGIREPHLLADTINKAGDSEETLPPGIFVERRKGKRKWYAFSLPPSGRLICSASRRRTEGGIK